MCGISGIISSITTNLEKKIFESLTALENRGYDSSGIFFIEDKKEIKIYREIFIN